MRTITPTFALVVAGGVAAGIALARPPSDPPVPEPSSAVAAPADAGAAGAQDGGGFLSAPAGQQDAATVVIADFAFGPPVVVAPGVTVAVDNRDDAPHTVTGDAGAFDTGTIDGGAAGSFVAPTTPGTHAFACLIHPSMRGELIVRG